MPSERIQRRIERLLDEAESAADRKDWPTVLEAVAGVLAVDPGNEDAEAMHAMAEAAAGAAPQAASRRPPTPTPPGEGATTADREAPVAMPGARSTEHRTPLPAALAAGRYQVVRLLGQGGRKRVYLAHDTRLERDVAVAAVDTAALDGDAVERIRREARAMARLGDHPNIVPVYDTVEDGDLHLIVSQYMAGGDLAALLRGRLASSEQQAASSEHPTAPEAAAFREGSPLTTARALAIAREVASALAHAHERGIVHRDLKPANVFLTRDGAAKLGDFGLAHVLDASALTEAGAFLGTAAYMPPEQALGQPADPRSDLYALGCILYELLALRPPFLGDDTVAVVTQHLNTPPVALSWHNPEITPDLEALVLRLLEKDPAKRPQTAVEALESLRTIADTPVSATTAHSTQHAAPVGGTDPIYRRTFVGREAELAALRAAVDAALSGQGGLAFVVGEPGIGKTSLCEQLATYAAMRGGLTLTGHCYEEGSLSLPYLPFIEAMRSYVLDRDLEGLRSELGSGAGYVSRIVSEVRDRLEVEPPPPVAADEERFRLLQAVTTFLRNASIARPLCLVLEDLHDADRGTLDLLAFLARSLEGARLLVVGTYRDVEVDRTHPLSAALAELRRSTAPTRITLRGLSVDETGRMLSNISGQEVQRSLAEAVFRQTEGNPLFVQEVVRFVAEQGLFRREGAGWTATTSLSEAIPEGLRDVIGKRLSRLSDVCNAVLAIASVIGREFDFETLAAIGEKPEEELLTAVEEAVHAAVIEERGSRGARYRFSHAFFRQTLYEELIAPRRIRIHQQVARALEAQHAARLDEHAAELAEHFSHSSDAADLKKAVDYSERAAKRAMSVYAHSEAVRLFEQAVQVQEIVGPEHALRRSDLLLALGAALIPLEEGHRIWSEVAPAAFRCGQDAGDVERSCEVAYLALRGLGIEYAGPAWERPEYGEWLGHLEKLAPPGSAHRARADLFRGIIRAGMGHADELDRAVPALDESLSLLDPGVEWLLYQAYLVYVQGPRFEERSREISARVAEAEELPAGADPQANQAVWSAASEFLRRGDREAGHRLMSRSIEAADRSRHSRAIDYRRVQRTLELMFEGRIAAAAEEGLDIERNASAGYRTASGVLSRVVSLRPLLYLGTTEALLTAVPPRLRAAQAAHALLLAANGHREEAREVLEQSLDYWESEGTPLDTVALWVLVAMLETTTIIGDPALAGPFYEALRKSRSVTTGIYYTTLVSRHMAAATALLGDPAGSRSRFERAIREGDAMAFRPEVALSRLGLAELLLAHYPGERANALAHLDFCIAEFRAMGMAPSLEKALRLKLEAQGVSSHDTTTSIAAVSLAASRDRADLSAHVADDGTVTLMFSDIESSTRLTEELGDTRWLELLREHNRAVEEAVAAQGGTVVKNRGDGFMLAFSRPAAGLECAIAIQRAFAGHAIIRVRIGLHVGAPQREGADFFGTDVNLAARVADQAAGTEVVVSEAFRERLGEEARGRFAPPREVELKGLRGRYRLYPVIRPG